MKRILYILTAAAIVLTGCTKELTWDGKDSVLEENDSVYPEGAQVDLVFAVPGGPQTKGEMADKPDIDNLFVAIFDGSGTLKEYVEATPLDGTTYVSENGVSGAQRFKARVTLKNAERRIHFIANAPAKSDVTGGMESTLLQQWMTEYDNAAFWQRIVLPNGITAYTFSDKDPAGNAWTEGSRVHFYYLIETDDTGKEIYTPVSSTTQGAQHAEYVITLASGRPTYTAGSMTVNPGDFVNAKGEKIVDGTGYFQSSEVAAAVELVPMVRNFARIKIVPEQVAEGGSAQGNFTPVEFYLMNIPDRGTIAPYSATVGGFVPQFTSATSFDEDGGTVVYDPDIATKTNAEVLASLNAGKYPASIPSGGALIQTPKEVKDNGNAIPSTWKKYTVAGTLAGTESAFLYERGLPNKNQDPTYLLVGGTMTAGHATGERWFKVELTDANGAYVRVFRDITYAIELGNITGSDGYGSAAEAALGTPVSDVSNAIATENLEQVNDGKGTSMWVKYIDYVGNKPEGETVTILYKVFDAATGAALSPTWDDDQDSSTPAVSRYTLTCDPEASETTSGAVSAVTADAAYSGADTPDGKTDWRIATVTLVKPSSTSILHSTLTIAGVTADGESSGSGKTLSRKVKYHVMNTQKLTLSATPLATEAAGEETKLTIKLPTGLGFSMFPLTLKIEAEKANLNPVASKNKLPDGTAIDLPVETGASYFSNQNSFGFLFTLNYSDYYNPENAANPYTTEFTLYFSTSKDYSDSSSGSNETWISVTDSHGYFEGQPADPADMYNPDKNHAVTQVAVTGGNTYFNISPVSQSVAPSATSATFSISTNSGNGWTVVGGNDVEVSTPSGSGNGVVTMSFSSNPNNAERTLSATVTPTSGTAKTITVTQAAPSISLNAESASVPASATYYDLDITSNIDWTAEVVSGNASIVKTKAVGEQVTGSGNGTVRISFDANTASTSRDFKVKVYATNMPTVSKTLTLTQRRTPNNVSLTITGLSNVTNGSISAQTLGSGTIQFTNVTHGRNGNSITLGYRSNRQNYPATITITPNSGATVTKLEITFNSESDAQNAVGTDHSAPLGWTYSRDGKKVTWTGEASSATSWTIGHNGNNGWPIATGLTVTYE